jgi:hypothetical protein
MQDIIIDGCKCTCESAQIATQQNAEMLGYLRIGLLVLCAILVILGVYISYKKLTEKENKDKRNKY